MKKFYGRCQDLIEKYVWHIAGFSRFLLLLYVDLSLGFVDALICLIVSFDSVMHEADDAYSIWSTWLDRFLTFSMFHWICVLFILLILVGIELSLCIVVVVETLFQNAITCFLESG